MSDTPDPPADRAYAVLPVKNTVLFPHLPLTLRAFEPRYRALVRDCIAHGREFGVVLIERGMEVGGGDSRFAVGTAAHLAEEMELPDGQWLIAARGTRRIRVQTWLPDDPYPLALVQTLPEAGLGIAVKADDGAGRAAQVMIAALIQRFGGFDEETSARLMRFISPRLFNWNGAGVGGLRPAGPLA